MKKNWWTSDAIALAFCGTLVLIGLLMSPTQEVVSIFGADVPVLCMFRRLTGYGCPGCGLTRSFSFMSHGQLWDAFTINPLGPVIFILIASQIPLRLIRLFRGWRAQQQQQTA